MLFIRRW